MQRLLTRPAFAERTAADPRALIIAPTRELAIQIDKDFRNLGRDTGLKSALIYGGVDYDKQREQLRGGVDIIIATPGRLLDYYKQHVFSLAAVEIMVIDEADRMFDLGFIKDVRFILRRLPERTRRQCMLFSATLSHRVLELAYEHMNEAQKLTVETDNVTADRVRQVIYFPASEEKLPLLINLLSRIDAHRSMVFVNMKVAAEKVARRLERQGFRVGMLSGDVPQKKRQSLLGKFQRGEIEILIATDVAARGLHIPDVTHVFNYDLPMDAEDYVHRIGRTARLGAEGDAISFACDMYAQGLPDIEAYIGQKIPVARVEPELLVVPPPRVPPAGAEGGDGESNIDTSARRPHAPKSRQGDGRRPRRDVPRDHAPKRAASKPAASAPANPAPTSAGGATASGTIDPARKRRRRGGRGRGRGEGGDVPVRNREGNAAVADKRQRGHQPVPTAPVAAPPAAEHKKPGFFRRLGNLFKRS
jgi:ATP-dependent RNA helicase RhlB